MDTTEITVDTRHRQIADLSEAVPGFCHGRGDGLLSVVAPHATAGFAIIELGSGSEPDLVELLARRLPRDDRYRHRHGSVGHGVDHVLPAHRWWYRFSMGGRKSSYIQCRTFTGLSL